MTCTMIGEGDGKGGENRGECAHLCGGLCGGPMCEFCWFRFGQVRAAQLRRRMADLIQSIKLHCHIRLCQCNFIFHISFIHDILTAVHFNPNPNIPCTQALALVLRQSVSQSFSQSVSHSVIHSVSHLCFYQRSSQSYNTEEILNFKLDA